MDIRALRLLIGFRPRATIRIVALRILVRREWALGVLALGVLRVVVLEVRALGVLRVRSLGVLTLRVRALGVLALCTWLPAQGGAGLGSIGGASFTGSAYRLWALVLPGGWTALWALIPKALIKVRRWG
ncbi:hypothetical protein EH165_10735 [Nakamurella antarctica]|uniref:Uncharacterized protein n=1 Tax=Nakamurella antarctica TaxID=1902245 RepID=A0A3G8ZVP7_9ACTN|nr:hypothetical protein [Nakamurella antarctica]AZI58534.1 hypothetical protein EH165_10735 [Nakamurella antarctica]